MFLADPLDVPVELVDYLAEQLGIEDPAASRGPELRAVRDHGRRERAPGGGAGGNRAAQAWGGGLVAAVDGRGSWSRSAPPRPGEPEVLRPNAGITWLNMVNDQGAGVAGKVLSGTPRDSLHAVDLCCASRAGRGRR